MPAALKNISSLQKNAVFETIIDLYDNINKMITEVEMSNETNKENTYIAILHDLIKTIDKAARIISNEYSQILNTEKINKISSRKIKTALEEIFDAVENVRNVLYTMQ